MKENNLLPLVSVAIVSYNQKRFLEECIESVLAQDYPNIEIVVADDGSTDGTQEMLRSYKREYPDKFVIKLSDYNQGITKNCNLALSACTGKYIAWIGGDDLMLPGKIRKQVEYMERHPECSISYHNLEVFDSKTGKTLFFFNDTARYEGDIKILLKYGCFNGASSTMVRRERIPKHGFDERIPFASDWLFWCETLLNGGEIHYIDEVLGRYRRRPDSITSSRALECIIDHLNSCNILLVKVPQYYKEILYRYSELLRLLRVCDETNFINFTKASLKIRLGVKPIISFIVYYFSGGKIKL